MGLGSQDILFTGVDAGGALAEVCGAGASLAAVVGLAGAAAGGLAGIGGAVFWPNAGAPANNAAAARTVIVRMMDTLGGAATA